jgi:hypothetical protein
MINVHGSHDSSLYQCGECASRLPHVMYSAFVAGHNNGVGFANVRLQSCSDLLRWHYPSSKGYHRQSCWRHIFEWMHTRLVFVARLISFGFSSGSVGWYSSIRADSD